MAIWVKRALLTLGFLVLVATNVLTLTNVAFNTALSGLVSSALGIQTVTGSLTRKSNKQARVISQHKAATRKFGQRLSSRARRVTATSLAAIPAESIPFIGIAALIAGTGYELYEICQGLRDMDQLYAELGMEDATPGDVLHSACNPSLPDADAIWSGLVNGS